MFLGAVGIKQTREFIIKHGILLQNCGIYSWAQLVGMEIESVFGAWKVLSIDWNAVSHI